ncbi:MAG: amino acid permease C-terminal domain-containing protein, partial [Miltoncostaeaceae bacterium]
LLAFAVVSWAVIDLRRKRPDLPRPFRIPGGPIAPILGIVTSLGVFLLLPPPTFPRLIVWMAAGVAIYIFYSRARAAKVIDDLIEAEEDPGRA